MSGCSLPCQRYLKLLVDLLTADAFKNAFQLLQPVVLLVLQQVVALKLAFNLSSADWVLLIFLVQCSDLLMDLCDLAAPLRAQHLETQLIDARNNHSPLLLEQVDVLKDFGR